MAAGSRSRPRTSISESSVGDVLERVLLMPERAGAGWGVGGRVAESTLHAFLSGADVEGGQLGIAVDELAGRDPVADQCAHVVVQRPRNRPRIR